jgi:hypothetical protein
LLRFFGQAKKRRKKHLAFLMQLKKRGKKKPFQINERVFKIGIDLLLRALGQLPSALSGLTALFGMGKGEPR